MLYVDFPMAIFNLSTVIVLGFTFKSFMNVYRIITRKVVWAHIICQMEILKTLFLITGSVETNLGRSYHWANVGVFSF